jgi:hypothetical protein
MAGIVDFVSSIKDTLLNLGPNIAIILIVLAGIVFGLSYTQPASNRGQWQSIAMGLFIGGVIVAALAGAAELIAKTSSTLLT